MHIRAYTEVDEGACVALLRSNVPEYFEAADEEPFRAFLRRLPGPYFVLEIDGRIAAAGGIASEIDRTVATLCWGIVDAGMHRAGLGSALLKHRMEAFLPEHPEAERLQVNTTQKTQGFFERHGFVVVEVRKDGYGAGLDHVRMERALTGPSR